MGNERPPKYQFGIREPIVGRLDKRPTILVVYDLMNPFPNETFSITVGTQQVRDYRFYDDEGGQIIQQISSKNAQEILNISEEEKIFKGERGEKGLFPERLIGDIERFKKGYERTLFSDIFTDYKDKETEKYKHAFEDAENQIKRYKNAFNISNKKVRELEEELENNEDNNLLNPLTLALSLTTGIFGTEFVANKYGTEIVSFYNQYLKEFVNQTYNLF